MVDCVAYVECVLHNVVQLRKFMRKPTKEDAGKLYQQLTEEIVILP